MKMTLLKMTQMILSSINGEQVDSISDTEESMMIADIIEECYYNILSESNLLEEKTLFELNASVDLAKPVLMFLPDDVIGLEWVKYNCIADGATSPDYRTIKYLPLEEFLNWTLQLSTTDSYVHQMTLNTGLADSINFLYRDDKAPEYYTSFDDRQLIFDSYDEEVDSTLQKNKTMCFGLKESSWQRQDDFIPALDSQQFNLLYQEAKATAWAERRQTTNTRAERKARRSWVLLASKKNRANYNHKSYYYSDYPDYGMKR
jgi:hypothetical protein